jgi:hypothetical protein
MSFRCRKFSINRGFFPHSTPPTSKMREAHSGTARPVPVTSGDVIPRSSLSTLRRSHFPGTHEVTLRDTKVACSGRNSATCLRGCPAAQQEGAPTTSDFPMVSSIVVCAAETTSYDTLQSLSRSHAAALRQLRGSLARALGLEEGAEGLASVSRSTQWRR